MAEVFVSLECDIKIIRRNGNAVRLYLRTTHSKLLTISKIRCQSDDFRIFEVLT